MAVKLPEKWRNPFNIPPHKIKPVVTEFFCPDHGTRFGRGDWVKLIVEVYTGISRMHFICDHLERVTVEEHPDNTIIYHRAPRIRPRRPALAKFDTDRRLEPF